MDLKKIVIYVGALVCFTQSLWAIVLPDHLDLSSQSIRSLGAGGAYTSIAEDFYAFGKNPAGLSRNAEQRKLGVQNFFANRVKDWSLQAGLIDGITEDPLHWGFYFHTTHTRDLRWDQYALGTSYNYENLVLVGISHRLSKFGRSRLARDMWAYGGQAGVLAFLTDWLSIGASGENIARSKSLGSVSPVKGSFGMSFNSRPCRIGLDVERNFSEKLNKFRFGIEAKATTFLIVRAGGFVDSKKRDMAVTTGFSLSPFEQFQLDFAVLDQWSSSFYVVSSGLTFVF